MQSAQIAVASHDTECRPYPDGSAWRAQVLHADFAALSDRVGDIQLLVQRLLALLGQIDAGKRSAIGALAARLQSLSAVLAGVARLPDGLVRGAPAPVISGQIAAAIAALGGSVGPTGIVLAYPGDDPALSQDIARLQDALAALLSRLHALLARLGVG